jgi:hypothetical protein
MLRRDWKLNKIKSRPGRNRQPSAIPPNSSFIAMTQCCCASGVVADFQLMT